MLAVLKNGKSFTKSDSTVWSLKPAQGFAGRSDLDNRRGMFSSYDSRSMEPRWRRASRHWAHHLRLVATFAPTGELWGARQFRLPVASDLQELMQP